jgi:hypothetical protein
MGGRLAPGRSAGGVLAGVRPAGVARFAVCFAVAAVLACFGTLLYASMVTLGPLARLPVGMAAACALIVAFALAARAWAGLTGVAGTAVGAFAMTQLMTPAGPGGDIIVPAWPVSYVWLVLVVVLPLATAFAPRRWFAAPPSAAPSPPCPPPPIESAERRA